MTKHHPAAFINAIAEEGTKEEAIFWLQKTWNELCELKDEQHLVLGERTFNALNMALPYTLEFDADSGGYYDTELSLEISAIIATLSTEEEGRDD